MAWTRERLRAYFRRTEGTLTLFAAVAAIGAIVFGLLGTAALRDRQAALDEAVDRRGALTSAAFDVYRTFADADAASLDAVLVDQQRSPGVQQAFRDDVSYAVDALREAASLVPGDRSAALVRQVTELVPQYVQLVETGWSATRNRQPVGTSYLAQASSLVRGQILAHADELRGEQVRAVIELQRTSATHAWAAYLSGVLLLVVLVAAQRFLRRRTRRRVNLGLAAATVLTLVPLVWLPTALLVVGHHVERSTVRWEHLVVPLAQARNLGRSADGDEARSLVYPATGDLTVLKKKLGDMRSLIEGTGPFTDAEPGPDRDRVDQAAVALRSWIEVDEQLKPEAPLTYAQTVALVTPPAGDAKSPAEQVDASLTAAITGYTAGSTEATASARRALDGLDVVFAFLAAGAAVAALTGLWPRIQEYR